MSARSFLATGLPAAANLRDRRARGGLGHLAARVGVDLGVEDEDVHVPAAGEDVVQAAVADVIRPAVAADDPDRFLDEVVGQRRQGCLRDAVGLAGEDFLELGDALALLFYLRRAGLRRVLERVDKLRVLLDGLALVEELDSHLQRTCPPRGACRNRTRRCPRRGSWTTPGRGRPASWCMGSWAGCRRRSTSIPSRWRSGPCRRRAG